MPTTDCPGDCPAAHSMDTTWFAVDDEGFVAAFDTGEDGALPVRAAAGAEAGNYDAWPLDALVIARLLLDEEQLDWSDDWQPTRDLHVVAVLAEGIRELEDLDEDFFVVHEAEPRMLASRQRISPARLEQLRASSEVTRVVGQDAASELFYDRSGPMYRFSNNDYGNPGNYTRVHDPARAINARDLPGALRAPLTALTLPVRFADSPHLHLADWLSDDECESWGDTTLRGEPRDYPPRAANDAGQGCSTPLVILVILAGLLALSAVAQ